MVKKCPVCQSTKVIDVPKKGFRCLNPKCNYFCDYSKKKYGESRK